jgi:ABC-type multidrug transport system ATPase subunit
VIAVRPGDAPAPAIALERVSRRFGPFDAVTNVSLELAPGAVYGLIGPNGAGKTTTLRMIAGLLEPTAGTVRQPVR